MLKFRLADRLGKTIAEIDRMTDAEFIYWAAYLDMVSKRNEPSSKPFL